MYEKAKTEPRLRFYLLYEKVWRSDFLRHAYDLARANNGAPAWDEVRSTVNRLLRGWCGYFSPGTHYTTDRAIEAHLYDRVRNFLVRRHKVPARSIGPFHMEAEVGDLGMPRLRHSRRQGVTS